MLAKRPKVAVIGAGIVGVSCALELADFCDVTVFEQEEDIMMWGTYGNQYRHHLGYHYPRSPETVWQCLKTQDDFFSIWKEAIMDDFVSYYAIAKEGSHVTAQEFLNFCDKMDLPHEIGYPDASFLNRDAVSICIKTKETAYDFEKLKKMAKSKMKEKEIELKLSHKVVGGKIDNTSKKKILKLQTEEGTKEEAFDCVVSAMYANHNAFGNWFNFSVKEMELRLKEVVIVKLPVQKRIAVTVMDGPFVTLVPTGERGIWTFGDVPRSIHEVKITTTGVPWSTEQIHGCKSRFDEMKKASPYFFPIISQAEYIKSMFTILPIWPESDETDERLTTVTNHGNGCWSVFEGKIVTCVTAAREAAGQIRLYLE